GFGSLFKFLGKKVLK
nr:RecName: Full=Short cationic peptide-1d; Short=SCP-1d; AltName: Full=Cupiennin 1-like peptide-1d; AltName: Full=Truncated variant of Cupiennin 1 family [Cupiennius salei]